MENKKIGNVIQFLSSENIGIIREVNSDKEFLFFIDELPRHEERSIKRGAQVAFEKNDVFKNQNIAMNLISIYQIKKVA